MRIGERQIADPKGGARPYVIAEIGVNHDGSVDRALELTRTAAEAGADAVKFQLFRADLLMSRASVLANYQAASGESDPFAMLRRLELSVDQLAPVVALAHQLGIHAIVTVFSLELVAEAERLAWDAYKTASPDIIHKPLLERLAATGKPLILSTGASTMEEVHRAIVWLRAARGRLAVLQCVSSYPTPFAQAELGGIVLLKRALDCPIGYSDHTSVEETGALAVSLGASILEKHFTYDTHAKGPDHGASLNGASLRRYIAAARSPGRAPEVEAMKRVLEIEKDVRRVSRQSIVAARPLSVGHLIGRGDLTFKRPGTGVPPFDLERVLSHRVVREVERDMPLQWDDLSPMS
ncbi:MAG: N-acetylneuraminate synthase family protein [Phycisphaeraceae bacterium]|nr:N-acetylneuraminate synthase family protein [Phycisphaeraceae bacterium]